ncbi:MAG: RecB family exonuclease [Candidatus Aminicenantaceae bacterium]
MPSFSISKIGTYETCPLQYKYAYVDYIKVEEERIENFLGIRVHEALEKLYRDKQFEKMMSLEELLAYYNELWEKNSKDSVIIVKKEYTQENYRKIGERQLIDYYNRYKPFDIGKIIGLETKDFMSLDEDGKYTFHIRIDRLMDMGNGLYEVHDYKTGLTFPKQEALDQDRQLAMYSLWVTKHFKDCKKVRLVWHFLAFDKELDSYRTKEQLEDLKKAILKEIKEIEVVEEFPANVSSLCDWCSYRGICPMWRHEVQLEEKSENEYLNDPGLKLADEYVRIKGELDEHRKEAEEQLEKLKEALISFCKRKGVSVVFGTENRITVKEYESVKLPGKNTDERDELIKLLKSMGRLDKVSDLDVYALSKILVNKEWDKKELEMLKKFWATEKSYRLSISKK